MMGVWSLWRRELVRFFRQPSRVAGAAGSPLLFWLFIGSGLSGSFRLPGAENVGYLEYFFPGTVTLVVLFAAIFSTISIIEDRREGFLQGVLAAPVPRASIVAGKVLGGATLAWLQGAAFLFLAPLAGLRLSAPAVLEAAGVLALLAVALTAIGFAFAWSVESVQGFHAIMNLILVPLWLLSGAVFPLTGAPAWLAGLMRIDPLTYGVAALRWSFYGSAAEMGAGIPGPAAALAILALLGGVAFAADLWVVRKGRVE
jgi:ABC-2 type transport system permease protein